jgi:hypothetical protein
VTFDYLFRSGCLGRCLSKGAVVVGINDARMVRLEIIIGFCNECSQRESEK